MKSMPEKKDDENIPRIIKVPGKGAPTSWKNTGINGIREDSKDVETRRPPEPDDRNRNTGARLETRSDDCT